MANTYELQFDHKQHLTSDIWEFHFIKPEGFNHQAGQFNYYTLPHANPDDRGIKRWFTISSPPTDPHLTITTRIFERMSSFKHALNNLEPGQTMHAEGPDGDFVLPDDASTALVLIGGGIGVTPYHSQVKELLARGQSRPITLLYGAKQSADFVYADLFHQAESTMPAFKLVQVVDQAPADWAGETGQITDELIKKYVPDLAAPIFYVSGPEPMVDAFEPRLQKLGITKTHLRQDWFPGYVDRF